MVSSKFLRLPTRGALGNGLRVVAGAVLATGGSLTVVTRNKRIQLQPEHDGTTTVVSVKPVKFPVGTRIEIIFGPALPFARTLRTGPRCADIFRYGKNYTGKTSPFWYDVPHFHELLSASDTLWCANCCRTRRLHWCQGWRNLPTLNLQRTLCKDVTRQQAAHLLEMARLHAKPVRPERLGAVGAERFSRLRLCRDTRHCRFGAVDELQAEIPFVVEAWAHQAPHAAI